MGSGVRGDGRRAVFLDRDGVLNRVVMRKGTPCSPRRLDEFEWHEGLQVLLTCLRTRDF